VGIYSIPFFVTLTSAALYAAGRRRGWSARALRPAAARLLECLGLALALLLMNVAAGVLTVLVLRAATGGFVSLYVATDSSLAPLSLAQAVLFQWWRALGGPPEARPPAP
jgi:hypothetical protein